MLVLPLVSFLLSLAMFNSDLPARWGDKNWQPIIVRQLHGSFRGMIWSVKTLVGDLCDLTAYAVPPGPAYVPPAVIPEVAFGDLWVFTSLKNHSDSISEVVKLPEQVVFSSSRDYILVSSGTALMFAEDAEMSLSVVNPLWEETCLWKVSNSPMTSAIYDRVTLILVALALSWLLWKNGFVHFFSDAYERGTALLDRVLDGAYFYPVSEKSYLDEVMATFEQEYIVVSTVEEQLDEVDFPADLEPLKCWVYSMVDAGFSCLERQLVLQVLLESVIDISKVQTVDTIDADDEVFTEPMVPSDGESPTTETATSVPVPEEQKANDLELSSDAEANVSVPKEEGALALEIPLATEAPEPAPAEEVVEAPEDPSNAGAPVILILADQVVNAPEIAPVATVPVPDSVDTEQEMDVEEAALDKLLEANVPVPALAEPEQGTDAEEATSDAPRKRRRRPGVNARRARRNRELREQEEMLKQGSSVEQGFLTEPTASSPAEIRGFAPISHPAIAEAPVPARAEQDADASPDAKEGHDGMYAKEGRSGAEEASGKEKKRRPNRHQRKRLRMLREQEQLEAELKQNPSTE